MSAIVIGVELNRILPLVSKSAHVGHRVRVVPALARREAAQPIRRSGRALSKHDRVIDERDVQPIARGDAEPSACLAWHDDLVLGADLDA